MPTSGQVTFQLTSGKVVGPFNGTLDQATPKDGLYLDVTKGGKDYPTKLDFSKFRTVSSIQFKPGVGKQLQWTTWEYFNNGQWGVDRFTKLG